jgi:GT2 family glycosyltransferase
VRPHLDRACTDLEGSPADAALVIVNYRTPDLVMRCLESVRATAGDLILEVVIVDNGSRDGSLERLRAAQLGATIVAETENRGFAAGVNAGLRASEAELAIVLNPDTETLPGALGMLVANLREHPRTGVTAPLLEDRDGSLQVSGYRRFPGLFTLFAEFCVPLGYALVYVPRLHPQAMSAAAMVSGERPAWVCGAALGIRRAAYEQAGPFDEGFFLYLEETEWQGRVAGAGWDIELVPDARVRHLVRGGEEALAPPSHFIASAVRYLRLRGVPTPLSRAVLALALASSWASLCAIALLPSKRARASRQARAYSSLLLGVLFGARRQPVPGQDRR